MTDLRITFLRPTVLVLAAMGFVLSLAVVAPMAKAQTQPPEQSASQAFTETQLQAFAVATLDVRRIAESYQNQVESAGSAEKQQALKEQQMDEMITAVEATGLQVAEYNAIQQAYAQDRQVRSMVDGFVEQIQQ